MIGRNDQVRHDDFAPTQPPPHPSANEPERECATPLDWLLVAALAGLSLGVVGGGGRWLWATFGEQIAAFFWSAVTLAY